KVSLQLEFEFENRMTDMLFGRYFEDICNSLVDSFTQRASSIYG
ncbi:MAG: ubiquinone-binding protein, partial [Proteobacteria bacterium]|nr:ubiquinone-binding protein [Pseudomonadota bacterium]